MTGPKSDNPPIKHHYIPAFYLSRWKGPDGRLCEYSRPHIEIAVKRRAPDAAGFEKRLYELEGYEPALAQQVEEKFFKPVDGWAADSLDLLERYGHRAPWDSHSRSAWTRFVLSLLLRCPEDIAGFREWWREDFGRTDDALEAQYRAKRSSDAPETFSQYLAARPISQIERHQFEILYSLVDNAGAGGKINDMHWRVLEGSDDGPTFLTSDRPVIRTNGLVQRGGHLALPISPRLLFIASHDVALLDDLLRAPRTAVVKEANKLVVQSAVSFVYGVDDSQLRFVQNRFGKVPQPRLMDSIIRRRREAVPLAPRPSPDV
ncbi:DUF4238 domain-containing protein [Bosea sp. TAB14]|uniref:DUF4238 domain-containing protein n=1 Tax=Bosea sp. TAB14 TaxID=3237481 RepID=UPI003F925242